MSSMQQVAAMLLDENRRLNEMRAYSELVDEQVGNPVYGIGRAAADYGNRLVAEREEKEREKAAKKGGGGLGSLLGTGAGLGLGLLLAPATGGASLALAAGGLGAGLGGAAGGAIGEAISPSGVASGQPSVSDYSNKAAQALLAASLYGNYMNQKKAGQQYGGTTLPYFKGGPSDPTQFSTYNPYSVSMFGGR